MAGGGVLLLSVEEDDRALPDCPLSRRLMGRAELGVVVAGLFKVAEAGAGAGGTDLVEGGPREEGRGIEILLSRPLPVGFSADGGT